MEMIKAMSSYHEDTELRLGLPGNNEVYKKSLVTRGNKRTLSNMKNGHDEYDLAPPTKAQVIGWPPVRSYRKNNCLQATKPQPEATSMYVKVNMDGAPYLRKIDLGLYKGYKELLNALENMFKLKDGQLSTRETDNKGLEYEPAYEDKDGDWMLVGDVPWEMFIASCNRLRIMKGSETKGLGCLA